MIELAGTGQNRELGGGKKRGSALKLLKTGERVRYGISETGSSIFKLKRVKGDHLQD